MSGWPAHFTDSDRQRALRLLALKGQRDRLDHERAKLRQDLSVELQRRCRNGQRTPGLSRWSRRSTPCTSNGST